MNPVPTYIKELQKILRSGRATELSYRSALENLLKELSSGDVDVINEPTQAKLGRPDLVLQRNRQPLGYIECKNIHTDLDPVEQSDQFRRYLANSENLILTNHLEFRWYRAGELVGKPVTVARLLDSKIESFNKCYDKLQILLQRFRYVTPSEIISPSELVTVMAIVTREIAERINVVLDTPDKSSFLRKHKNDLEIKLLPTLSNSEFADMYAQTLAYALFVARVQHIGRPEDFTLQNAFFNMPNTNPFLHREFRDIVNQLDDRVQGAVDQLARYFALTKMDEMMEGFGSRTEQRDPVIHFYEDFLAAYNPQQRARRGVYFTPEPVVGYIVRSVDALLRSHFGRRDGLADPCVHILDPAAGTGSFLARVINFIHEIILSSGQSGIWPDYVHHQLLPRLHGFELLMAPYTLAHMRLGLLLEKMGSRLRDDKRLSIYLINSLDRSVRREEQLPGEFRNHIEMEADFAAEVKNEKPIMVVLGQPTL